MTLGDAAEPLVRIKDSRMDFGDTEVIRFGLLLRLAVHLFRYGSIEDSTKLSIAVTFRRNDLAAG